MTARTFTAHVEGRYGVYTNFQVIAPTLAHAWQVAKEQLEKGEHLQGITENDPETTP